MAPQQGHRKDMKRYDVKIFKIFLLTLFLVYLPLIMYIFWERYNAAWAHTVEKHRFNFPLFVSVLGTQHMPHTRSQSWQL